MHLSLVTETYPPEVNGVALTVHNLRQELLQLGHRVELVRPRQSSGPAAGTARDELTVPGARLPRYPDLQFGLPAQRRLRKRWRQERPDAVYVATEGPLGWSAARAARGLAIPVASGFHTRFDDYMARYGAGFLTPLAFAWLRRFHNGCDATLVPTEELAAFLRERGVARVRVQKRGVDAVLFDPKRRDASLRAQWSTAPDALIVAHVGRIAAEKNLDLAVRAFRELQAAQPRARFVWVGDGPARASLQCQNPDFVFTGTRRGEELARCFASADLFLFPSLSETFGNVTLEAMASGVATVAFDYGAAREHLLHGLHGLRVPCGSEEAFIGAACRIAADRAELRTMGLAAREAVLDLRPRAVAAAFVDVLATLRSGARR